MNNKIIFGGVLLSIIIFGLFVKRDNFEGFSSCKIGCKAPSKQTGNCTYKVLPDGTFDKTQLSCPWNCETQNAGNENATQCMYDSDCAGCLPAALFNNNIRLIGATGGFDSTSGNNLGNTGPVNSTPFINLNAGTNDTSFDADLYMLKSSYVPPICPAYPEPEFNKKKKKTSSHKKSNQKLYVNQNTRHMTNQTQIQNNVPLYMEDSRVLSNIPLPVLPDFTTYGM
jgi:hypothetical protein